VTTPGSGTAAQNINLGKLMAGGYGWTGSQFTDLVKLWTQESGWRAGARNSSSGAFGIAQALGHGTADTAAADGTNEYGPDNGVSVATAKAANSGSATAQIAWGLAYIHATYGSPSAAWAHEQAYGWY
jgi:resuscitation-promoting factor RpfB